MREFMDITPYTSCICIGCDVDRDNRYAVLITTDDSSTNITTTGLHTTRLRYEIHPTQLPDPSSGTYLPRQVPHHLQTQDLSTPSNDTRLSQLGIRKAKDTS